MAGSVSDKKAIFQCPVASTIELLIAINSLMASPKPSVDQLGA